MRCLSAGELARPGAQDDPHLADCVACRSAVAEQRAIRELLGRAPAPPLPRARREAIAAEVMAHAYTVSGRRTSLARGGAIGALVCAAAAVLALALWPAPEATIARAELALPEDTAMLSVRGVTAEAVPEGPPRRVALVRPGGTADFTRLTSEDREVLELRNGALTIDARDARELEITMRGASLRIDDAKLCVVANAGTVSTVSVFAGSVEVTSRGKVTVVEAGMVWMLDAVGPTTALREFRAGWGALRDADLRGAVAAFDRARAPVVAEDAAYWAGVAAERLGDRGDAARRFAGFLELFPASPHVESARIALARVRR